MNFVEGFALHHLEVSEILDLEVFGVVDDVGSRVMGDGLGGCGRRGVWGQEGFVEDRLKTG